MGEGEDGAENVVKVVPTAEELQPRAPGLSTQCWVPGCGLSFKSWPQLALHQKKTHGIDTGQLSSSVRKVPGKQYCYHCPVAGCVYDANSPRYFSVMKCLRQHFLLCHAERHYSCDKCGRGFALECYWRNHQAACGKIFCCETCSCPYTTLEALRTHCLRKQHPLPPQYCKPPRPEKQKPQRIPASNLSRDTGNLGPCFVIFQVVNKNSSSSGNADTPSPSVSSQLRPILPKAIPAPSLPLYPTQPRPLRLCLPPGAEGDVREATQARETTARWHISDGHQQQSAKDGRGHSQVSIPVLQSSGSSPSTVHQTCAATQVAMVTRQDVGLQQTTETSSTGMQTTVSLIPNKHQLHSSVGTQISVSDILQSAMKSADIPTERREDWACTSTESQTSWDPVDGISPPRKRQRTRQRSKRPPTQPCGNPQGRTREWPGTNEDEHFFEIMAHISTQTPALSSADAAVGSSEPMGSSMQSVESQTNLQSPGGTALLPPGPGLLMQGMTSQTVQSCLRDAASLVDATIQTADFSSQSQTQTHLSFFSGGTPTLVDAQLQTLPMTQHGVLGSQEGATRTASKLLPSSPFLDADSFFSRAFSSMDSSVQTSNLPLMVDASFFAEDIQSSDFPIPQSSHSLGQGFQQRLSRETPTSGASSSRVGSVLQDAATSPGATGSDLQSSQTQTWLSAFSIGRGSSPALGEASSLRLDAGARERDLVLSPCFSMGVDMDDDDFMTELLDQQASSLPSRLMKPFLSRWCGMEMMAR